MNATNEEWNSFLDDVAGQVDSLIIDPANMGMFRRRITPFAEQWKKRDTESKLFEGERAAHWQRVKTNPGLQEKSADPPENGWKWDAGDYLRGLVPGPEHEMPAEHVPRLLVALEDDIRQNEQQPREGSVEHIDDCKRYIWKIWSQYEQLTPEEKTSNTVRILTWLDSDEAPLRAFAPVIWYEYLEIPEEKVFGCWRPPLPGVPENPIKRITCDNRGELPAAHDRTEQYERYYITLAYIHDSVYQDAANSESITKTIWPSMLAAQVQLRFVSLDGQLWIGPNRRYISTALKRVKAELKQAEPEVHGQGQAGGLEAGGSKPDPIATANAIIAKLESLRQKPSEHTRLKDDDQPGIFNTKLGEQTFKFFGKDGFLWDMQSREPAGHVLQPCDIAKATVGIEDLLRYLRLNDLKEVHDSVKEAWDGIKKGCTIVYSETEPEHNLLVRLQQELELAIGALGKAEPSRTLAATMDKEPSERGQLLDVPGLVRRLKALRSALDSGDKDRTGRVRGDLRAYVGSPERLYGALQEPLRGSTADTIERLTWVGDARKSRMNTGLYGDLLDALAAPEFIGELERWQEQASEQVATGAEREANGHVQPNETAPISEQLECWSRPMPLTAISDRILKDPKKTRKLKSVYRARLKKVGDKSWVIRLDGLPPNIIKELERP